MAYTPYEWTVNSYLNPTRMNAIEQGIAEASQAAESASGEFHTIEELIGTQSIAGIGDGTLTGATWKINNDLTELSGVVTTLNSKIKDIAVVEGTFKNDNSWKFVPYPTGFNSSNCFVTCVKVDFGGAFAESPRINDKPTYELYEDSNVGGFQIRTLNFFGKDFKVLLQKI